MPVTILRGDAVVTIGLENGCKYLPMGTRIRSASKVRKHWSGANIYEPVQISPKSVGWPSQGGEFGFDPRWRYQIHIQENLRRSIE